MFRKRPDPPEQSPLAVKHVQVIGARTAFVEIGDGVPIICVNAGLGASTIWHRLLPALGKRGRAVAFDMMGTGGSDRVVPEFRGAYRLADLRNHFGTFLQLVGVNEPAVLVTLGLGTMVAFDWAANFPARVRAICHMESIIEPWTSDMIPAPFEASLRRARSEEGERYVIFSDSHFEEINRSQVIPRTEPGRLDRFRLAYGMTPDRRRLQLSLLEQIPIDGQPAETSETVERYGKWLQKGEVPALLILGQPGYLLHGVTAERARALPNQRVVEVAGTHLLPEDSPDGVTRLLLSWLDRVIT